MDSLLGLTGIIGVIFLLLGYFLLIIGQVKVTDTHHTILNVLGALLVVITLHTGGNVPIFSTLVVWLLISIFGLYKHHLAVTK